VISKPIRIIDGHQGKEKEKESTKKKRYTTRAED
jgi:hypothetical protein